MIFMNLLEEVDNDYLVGVYLVVNPIKTNAWFMACNVYEVYQLTALALFHRSTVCGDSGLAK